MKTSILLALGVAAWESRLVAAITRPDAGFVVVRRCTDLADLLGVAGTLSASLVLVGSDLPRLDRATVLHLEDLGLTVIGLHAADYERSAASYCSVLASKSKRLSPMLQPCSRGAASDWWPLPPTRRRAHKDS
jgi:hypothetical protein